MAISPDRAACLRIFDQLSLARYQEDQGIKAQMYRYLRNVSGYSWAITLVCGGVVYLAPLCVRRYETCHNGVFRLGSIGALRHLAGVKN